MIVAHVFLARMGAGAFARRFTFDSEFDPAGIIEITEPYSAYYADGLDPDVDPAREPMVALEDVFAICNSYAGDPPEFHCDRKYEPDVIAWRQRGNRSLSVGDVVAIGESFYFCASAGWDVIAVPSPKLMSAFILSVRGAS